MKQAFLLLLLCINHAYGETNGNADPNPFGISFFVLILAGILLSFLLWKRNSFSDKRTQPSSSTNLKQKIKKRQQEIQKDISEREISSKSNKKVESDDEVNMNNETINPIDDDSNAGTEYFCAACSKGFKTEQQWKQHEQSKKHIQTLKQLRIYVNPRKNTSENEVGNENNGHSTNQQKKKTSRKQRKNQEFDDMYENNDVIQYDSN